MSNFWQLIYNYILIPIFYVSINLLSIFNNKIRTALKDRRTLFENLELSLEKTANEKPVVWFHSSSVGEFEQAKPIIEHLNSNNSYIVLVSFLSPSGYNAAKRYDKANIITYYPFDSKKKIKRFIDLIKPSILIFMRYDIWPNSVFELSKRKIPILLVDATLKKNSPRKLPLIRNFHSYLFNRFNFIITISEEDRKGFLELGVEGEKVITAGDTRFDRVFQKSQSALKQKILNENIIKDKKVFVAGSTWEEDEEVLFPALNKIYQYEKKLLTIIVPHEPSIQTLEQIEYELGKSLSLIRFSLLNQYNGEEVILVDSVGILLTLYAYADVAFVGGGFKSNIHNILEPAVYGIPVIFGPKYSNSQEAFKLIENEGGFSVKNKNDLYKILRKLLANQNYRNLIGENAKKFVQSNIGATERITKILINFLNRK